MAAAIAASALPHTTVESAGWSPQDAIAGKAISVVKEMTGRDISAQRPRDVAEIDLAQFDLVVVLEPRVAEELDVPSHTTLLVWDVPDPYGRSLDDCRQCAEDLRVRIEELGP